MAIDEAGVKKMVAEAVANRLHAHRQTLMTVPKDFTAFRRICSTASRRVALDESWLDSDATWVSWDDMLAEISSCPAAERVDLWRQLVDHYVGDVSRPLCEELKRMIVRG